MMKAEELIFKAGTWLLGIILVASVSAGVASLKDLSGSVNELNLKIGIMVERTDGMQKKIEDHEDRLRFVEKPKNKP